MRDPPGQHLSFAPVPDPTPAIFAVTSVLDASSWPNPANISSTVLIVVLAAVGFWLLMRVVRAGFSLLALVLLWLVAAWLFGLPPIGGDGVLS